MAEVKKMKERGEEERGKKKMERCFCFLILLIFSLIIVIGFIFSRLFFFNYNLLILTIVSDILKKKNWHVLVFYIFKYFGLFSLDLACGPCRAKLG